MSEPSCRRVWGQRPGQPKAEIKISNSRRETKNIMYEDRTLVCRDCGKEFIFSAGEQEFYARNDFKNDPVRCPECRKARKNAARGQQSREMFDAVCAACGKPTKVPFQPRNDKPIYCSECFAARRGR